jgi:6-phosphogluconate dehydrogenase
MFRGEQINITENRAVLHVALRAAVPAQVLTAALYERFSSRGEADFANKLLSAMRYEFGGHLEKAAPKGEAA